MLDVLIRGGTVVDGTGRRGRPADVAIAGGRIVEVGPLPAATADRVIDAAGFVVAPGFVDIHSHGDVTLLADPRARSAVAQGVTTVVVGNCGHSPAPLPAPLRAALPDLSFGYQEPFEIGWTGFGGYLDALDAARPAVNVASLAGHNALRVAALGLEPRAATAAEQRAMVAALARALDEGAFGLSSGLEYPLGRAAARDELVTLAEEVRRRGGLYAFHTRDRDFRAVQAFDEAFEIAQETGVAFQISHIAPRRGAPVGALDDVLERIERERALGVDVACDQHTRLHGITKLATMLPPSASAAGTPHLLAQLRDPRAREAFHAFREPIHKLGLMGHWDQLWLFEASRSPEWVGRDFASIAAARGQHPLDAIMDILLEADEDAPNVLFIGLVQTQDDLDRTFASPHCAPESDATILATDGPLAGQRFLGAYTWATNYLRSAVRERRILTLEEGVRRLTQMPAERVGLDGRGTLRPGAWADVTIFDPAVVAERGTVETPNAYPDGIRTVLVNGAIAVDGGAFVEPRTGHVLRRSQGGTP